MLPIWYSEYKNFIDTSINTYLNKYFKNKISNWGENFKEIIFYATRWWKRIRSILALEMYLIFSHKTLSELNENDDIVKFIISIECIHSYSLIHDDLPCMDNDEYRRWELTTWKKFGEYQAVLAWDLLNTLSFEILSEIDNSIHAIKLVSLLSSNTWLYWMIWWQVDDMYFDEKKSELTYNNLVQLHNNKTWALIKSSIIWPLILSDNSNQIAKFTLFWEKIWLAFQIKDDLLDVEWSLIDTWKSVWWERKWFVYFLWIEKTKKELEALIEYCLHSAKELKSEKLEFIVRYIGDRNR